MVDIQPATAEIRRGIKKKKKETTGQKYNVRICCTGRHKTVWYEAIMHSTHRENDLNNYLDITK